MRASGTHSPQGAPLHPTSALGQSASPLRVRPTTNRNFALGAADGIADVANGVNQRRFTELFPEPANEHLNQLGIVFVGMANQRGVFDRPSSRLTFRA